MCESCCVTVCGLWSVSVGGKYWKQWHDGVCLAQSWVRRRRSPPTGVDGGMPRSETYRCTSGRRRASGNLRCTRSDTSRECWRTSAGIPRWTPRTHSHLRSHRETSNIISSEEQMDTKRQEPRTGRPISGCKCHFVSQTVLWWCLSSSLPVLFWCVSSLIFLPYFLLSFPAVVNDVMRFTCVSLAPLSIQDKSTCLPLSCCHMIIPSENVTATLSPVFAFVFCSLIDSGLWLVRRLGLGLLPVHQPFTRINCFTLYTPPTSVCWTNQPVILTANVYSW